MKLINKHTGEKLKSKFHNEAKTILMTSFISAQMMTKEMQVLFCNKHWKSMSIEYLETHNNEELLFMTSLKIASEAFKWNMDFDNVSELDEVIINELEYICGI
jgi:hypothetical protein